MRASSGTSATVALLEREEPLAATTSARTPRSRSASRSCRSSSRCVMHAGAHEHGRRAPRPSARSSCTRATRSRSASLDLARAARRIRSMRRRVAAHAGVDHASRRRTAPRPRCRAASDVTRSAPVFRLRSSSWKTSWMPSSRSGPSIAMRQTPARRRARRRSRRGPSPCAPRGARGARTRPPARGRSPCATARSPRGSASGRRAARPS